MVTATGLTPRFLIWFVVTWLLCNLAEAFGLARFALPDGSGPVAWAFFMLEWFFIWDMPRVQRTLVAFAICLVIWALSWFIGRMRGQPQQMNAIIAALSCGLAQWLWRAFDVLRVPDVVTEGPDPARLLPAVLAIAAFPILIGPPVAAHLYRRSA